ncbi:MULTISPECIES: hypothetical protein [Bizionia]|uniref:Uncharacterized protein n=1 Tax=Bizionia algoritergicola TaxID=291187 RepID=A0A5D0QUV6_9FLAO|nr:MULTISPECIES: hypothetical protein [Bizionia]OBX22025.1 hypothetical protein BAA08_10115 [Bizionia sp. APA-3]TYB71984.1 hypothetical protein ES675_12515 [Bizionia algoritergicola]
MKNPNTFWNWFIENQHKFLQQQKPISPSSHHLKPQQLTDNEVLYYNLQTNLNNYCNNLSFVLIGPSAKKSIQQLIITTNGNKSLILYAANLICKAPKLPGWKFTASIKPRQNLDKIVSGNDSLYEFQNLKIKISDLYFLPTNYCSITQKFDITVYLTEYWKHPQQLLQQAITIMLEDLLGEHLAYSKINHLTIKQYPKNTNLINAYDMKSYFETFSITQ